MVIKCPKIDCGDEITTLNTLKDIEYHNLNELIVWCVNTFQKSC